MSVQGTTDAAGLRTPLRRALKTGRWQLNFAVLTAAGSGLAMLGALWWVVRLIAEPGLDSVLWACTAWVLGAALSASSSWLAHEGEARFASSLRRRTAEHLAGMPMRDISKYSGNDLRRLIGDDVAALHHMVAHFPSEIATLVIVPLTSIALLLACAGPIGLLVLIPGALATAHFLIVVPRMSARYGEQTTRVMGEILTAVDDYAAGMRTCRIYGVTSGAASDYARATRNFTEGFVGYVRKVSTFSAVATAFLQAVATYAIAYAVGYDQQPEVLAAMLFFGLAIVTPAMRLGHGIDYIRSGRVAAQRITKFLAGPTLPVTRSIKNDVAQGLRLSGLTLMQDDRPLVRNLTHTFEPGTVTTITGPSGSGKSTLLRFVAGLDTAHEGEIQPGGSDAESAPHRQVLLIPQGGDLLPGTIRATVSLGSSKTDDGSLLEALRRAQLELPLNTPTEFLSGGERQRLGIARAFLSSAPTILLDEPTSALDDTTSIRVLHELRTMTKQQGCALVIVTHDPRIAEMADVRLSLDSLSREKTGMSQ
ncbi:ABC transporter ATP-binding protein [Leucobacter zeae]|nr:ABC transporter ATP-binding protein [Leucobacter zeae]